MIIMTVSAIENTIFPRINTAVSNYSTITWSEATVRGRPLFEGDGY